MDPIVSTKIPRSFATLSPSHRHALVVLTSGYHRPRIPSCVRPAWAVPVQARREVGAGARCAFGAWSSGRGRWRSRRFVPGSSSRLCWPREAGCRRTGPGRNRRRGSATPTVAGSSARGRKGSTSNSWVAAEPPRPSSSPETVDPLVGAIVLEDLDLLVNCTAQRVVPRDPHGAIYEIE